MREIHFDGSKIEVLHLIISRGGYMDDELSSTEIERNWPAFWTTLCWVGVEHLAGQESWWRDAIAEVAQKTDMLDSDAVYCCAMSPEASPEVASLEGALEWLKEVRAFMQQFPYSQSMAEVAKLKFTRVDALTEALVAALTSPCDPSA